MRLVASLTLLLLVATPLAAACGLGTAGEAYPDCPPQDDPVSDLCRAGAATPFLVEDVHSFANEWLGAVDRPGESLCAADAALCDAGGYVDFQVDSAWQLAFVSLDAADFFVDALSPFAHIRDDDVQWWNDTVDAFLVVVPGAEDVPLLCGLGYEAPCALAGLPPQAQRDAVLLSHQAGTAQYAPGVAYDVLHAAVHAARELAATRALPCPTLP